MMMMTNTKIKDARAIAVAEYYLFLFDNAPEATFATAILTRVYACRVGSGTSYEKSKRGF